MLRLPPLPAPPAPAPRVPFPLVAVIAPLVGAVAIGLLVRSPFVLVFAILSPLIALATMADGRRQARRHVRDERARFEREVGEYEEGIERAHAVERLEADRAIPPAHRVHPMAEDGPLLPLRIGVAPRPSRCAPDAPRGLAADADGGMLRTLHERAATHPALPVALPPGPIVVLGRGAAASNLRRLISAAEQTVLVEEAAGTSATTVVDVRSATRARLEVPGAIGIDLRLEPLTALEVEQLQRTAAPTVSIPTTVPFAALPLPDAERPARVAIGIGEHGVVHLDLVREGPHALVGGTTGSGKSELLRTLVLGWASVAAPREHSVLLVDFKGGAAFAGLAELPHVVGLMTDLAPEAAERALRSLRAELRRRERLLLEHGCRDIAELRSGVMSRLLVLIDEYAALIESVAELAPLFADLSARGRSLGIHLVLCTQRPAGVVRDAVVANCAIRIAFRATSAAECHALLGSAIPGIETAPAGRAVVSVGGAAVAVQVARVDHTDITAVRTRHQGSAAPQRPWLEPLPEVLAVPPHADEPHSAGGDSGWGFGVADRPEEQRRVVARWSPRRDGALLVVGATGSGRTGALAALGRGASGAGAPVAVVPSEPAAAWEVLTTVAETGGVPEAGRRPVGSEAPSGALLLLDDLDALLAAAGDAAPGILERLDAAVRALRATGGGLAASVRALTGLPGSAVARFDSVLLLRAASLDEHRLAGGVGVWNRHAPPGRGFWHGALVQVGRVPEGLPAPLPDPIVGWEPPPAPIAVVSSRPKALAARLADRGRVVELDPSALDLSALDPSAFDTVAPLRDTISSGHSEIGQAQRRGASASIDLDGDAGRRDPSLRDASFEGAASATPRRAIPLVVVADAELWQSAWGTLNRIRRESTLVFADVTEAEVRLLLGHRSAPPPRRAGALDEVWIAEAGEPLRRARWAELA